MSLPLLIIPGGCVERQRLTLIAVYNPPYRDFLFVLFFHPPYTYICRVTRTFCAVLRMYNAAFADVWMCHTTTLRFLNERVSMLR